MCIRDSTRRLSSPDGDGVSTSIACLQSVSMLLSVSTLLGREMSVDRGEDVFWNRSKAYDDDFKVAKMMMNIIIVAVVPQSTNN